jgi:hypothetical protein
MRVKLYAPYFSAAENAEVEIVYNLAGGLVTFPKFYIANRVINGNIVELTCRCQLQKLDRPFSLDSVYFDENREVYTYSVVNTIAAKLGLGVAFSLNSVIPKLSEKFLKSNNCLLILEKLSEALAGYWRIWNNSLTFVPFEEPFMQAITAENHGKVRTGVRKSITRVVMTGGGETFDKGYGEFSQTVCIDTELACEELASNVYTRLCGLKYYPVTAVKCQANVFPAATSEVTFPQSDNIYGQVFRINSIKAYPRRSGFYLELSNNAVREDEWDYSGKLGREVKRLNQLFSELEEGGDGEEEPQPVNPVIKEIWKSDRDWAAFDAMPAPKDVYYASVMVKVISDSTDVNLYVQSPNSATYYINWGDGSPEDVITVKHAQYVDENQYAFNYRTDITHKYPKTGIYYFSIRSRGGNTSALILIPKDRYTNNPPLIIGYKIFQGAWYILFNGPVWGGHLTQANYPYSRGYNNFFFATKFLDLTGYYSEYCDGHTMLYNSTFIDWIKNNYTGINGEEDLVV